MLIKGEGNQFIQMSTRKANQLYPQTVISWVSVTAAIKQDGKLRKWWQKLPEKARVRNCIYNKMSSSRNTNKTVRI